MKAAQTDQVIDKILIGWRFPRRHLLAPVAVTVLLALSGCDIARNIGRSDDDRINEARPLSAEFEQAVQRLRELLAADKSALASLEGERESKLKVRAVTCSDGYSPSILSSVDSVREHLPREECFRDFDRTGADWINARRLAIMLAQSPLSTAQAETPQIISASSQIDAIRFASEAAIAVVSASDLLEVIDLSNGKSLFIDRESKDRSSNISVSPNGRVFAIVTRDGMAIRSSTTGEVLLRFANHIRLAWLDTSTAVLIARERRGVELFDFVANKFIPVKGTTGGVVQVFPLPGAKTRFVVAAHNSLFKYELHRDSTGVDATLSAQQTAPTVTWADDAGDVTADGTHYVHIGNEVWITDLDSLESRQVVTSPFRGSFVTAMPQSSEVLLQGSLVSDYSSSNRATIPKVFMMSTIDASLALVEDSRLMPTGDRYSRVKTVFVPSLEQIAVISGANLKMLGEVQRGFKGTPQALIPMFEEELRVAQQKNATVAAQLMAAQNGTLVRTDPVNSQVADLARNARIQAIAVHESSSGAAAATSGYSTTSKRTSSATRNAVRRPGPVNVIIRDSKTPIVLVLSSHEPVYWRIGAEATNNIKAILVAGDRDSTVMGAGSASVIQIGNYNPYARGDADWNALLNEVKRWTGKTIDDMQGQYRGSTFIVGKP